MIATRTTRTTRTMVASVLALLAAVGLLALATPADAADGGPSLYLYDGEGRAGESVHLTWSVPDLERIGWDDRVSSYWKFGGRASIYEDRYYQGVCQEIGDRGDLWLLPANSASSVSLNGSESCGTEIILFSGYRFGIGSGVDCTGLHCLLASPPDGSDQLRGYGRGGHLALTSTRDEAVGRIDLEDSASSLLLPYGGVAAVYQDRDFRGRCMTVDRSIDDLRETSIGNDTISSVVVGRGCQDGAYVYSGPEQKGTYQILTHDVASSSARSVTNGTGRNIGIYSREGFRGACIKLPPNQSTSAYIGSLSLDGCKPWASVAVYSQPGFAGGSRQASLPWSADTKPVVGLANGTESTLSAFTQPDGKGGCVEVDPGASIADIGARLPGATSIGSIRSGSCPAPPVVRMEHPPAPPSGPAPCEGCIVVQPRLGPTGDLLLRTDISDLQVPEIDMNDKAVKVTNPSPNPMSLYSDVHYRGACTTVPAGETVMLSGTAVGPYRASSLRAYSPCANDVRLFSHVGFNGSTTALIGSKSDIPAPLAGNVSSIQNLMTTPIAIYSLPDWKGRCQTVNAGQSVASLIGSDVGNDAVSSVRFYARCAAAADLNAMPDLDHDGRADLVVVNRQGPGGRTTVGLLSPTDTYKTARSHAATALGTTNDSWEFDAADVDRDGFDDLLAIDRRDAGSRRTVLHVMDGRDPGRMKVSRITALPMTDEAWSFEVGDVDRDGWADLVSFDRSSKNVVIRTLSAKDDFATVQQHIQTSLRSERVADFALADLDNDGFADVLAIDGRPGARVAVSVLSMKDGFRSVRAQLATAMVMTHPDDWEFESGDANGDGRVDLLAVNRRDVGSNRTAVFTMSSEDGFKSFIGADFTALAQTSTSISFE